jgi:hypothetical protein
MTDRKKPGVAFWATVVFALPVLYILSFGPACWIASRTEIDRAKGFQFAYWPLGRAIHADIPFAASILQGIARCGMSDGGVILPGGPRKGQAYDIVLFRTGPISLEEP